MAAPLHVAFFCPLHRRAAYSYSSEAQIYAPASAAPYFEAQGGGGGGGAQVTTAASSPTAIPSHNMVGITMDIGGSQILSGSGAYLIHGGLENSRHSLSHTSRSSPATVCSPAGSAARGPAMIPKGTEKASENKTELSLSLCMSVTCHVCKGENRHWCTALVLQLVLLFFNAAWEKIREERALIIQILIKHLIWVGVWVPPFPQPKHFGYLRFVSIYASI